LSASIDKARAGRAALGLLLLLLAGGAAPPSRPRICLALSGGGSRGVAHVAVLEVLEEERVPIDCIAGTSMGAIVGGLYASGLSTAQIREAIQGIDWNDLFNDRPPRRDLTYRRKEDDTSDLIRIDTTNPGDNSGPGERAAAEHVAAILAGAGLEPQILESERTRASVVARWEGTDPARPALLIHGHLHHRAAVSRITNASVR